MSTEKINLNGLNSLNFQLGPSVNYQPEQQTPELYFSATAPVMFGRSFFNNFQTLLAPITPYTLEGAEKERYGIMPDTTLASIANTENWKPIKPSGDDFWEFRKASYLLSGGAGSGFLGKDVDLFALERSKMGYWSGPYFQIKNPLIENMDQTEKDYNTYLQRLKQAKEEVKGNLGQDGDQIAYLDEGIPRTKDGNIAWSSSGDINIKYDGKEIPSHIVPEPMTMEQFKERTKAFTDAGSLSRWMLSTQAEGGYLSGNALIGALIDTAFDNPLYKNNLDNEYAKQTAIKLSLAKYSNGFNIFEMGVGTIADDIKSIIEKKEPNFDGSMWFDQLQLPKEVRETLVKKGISSIDFIGANNKNHALFILQDKVFKTTLQEKVDAYTENNKFFQEFYGDIVGFGADFATMAINDPDLGIGAAATILTAGAGAAVKGTAYSLKAAGYLKKAAKLRKALKLTNKTVHTVTSLATGELPTFMQNISRLKQLSYFASTGAALNTVAALKDQNTRIALSMTGLQTEHQFEYSYSDLAVAGGIGAAFGGGIYGITQGLGKIKKWLKPEKDKAGRTRMVTAEGTDATTIGPTPLTRDGIEDAAAATTASVAAVTPEPTAPKTEEATPTTATSDATKVEPIKTIDIEIEGNAYKFREDEVNRIEPTANRNTVENIYVEQNGNVYEISKLSIAEARERANPKAEAPSITGEKKTRLERVASDAEKFSDRATIREEGRTGTLGMAPESPTFNRREGESSIDFGRRSIRDGQVNDVEDWKRIATTKEEIASIREDKGNPVRQVQRIRDIATRALDILKQLKESKSTDKDSTWFTDQEIKLNRHIEDLNKVEQTIIGRRFKVFEKLSKAGKTKFLELAKKFKDVPKENFDKLINEEKGLSRSFRKTLKEYLYGKETLDEKLKIKETDSPVVKRAKTVAQATFKNRKNQTRSLNKAETAKAQKAFLDPEFAKNLSPEHRRLLEHLEQALDQYGVDFPWSTEAIREKRNQVKKEVIALISACIANLKLNPLKLTNYIDTSLETNSRRGTLGTATSGNINTAFEYRLQLQNLYDTDVSPENTARSITKIALHELGHIFSYVLNIEDQKRLVLAYTEYADIDLIYTLDYLEKVNIDQTYVGVSIAHSVNVAEFFANMFQAIILDRTEEAISRIETNSFNRQNYLVKLMYPFFKYIKDVATQVTENLINIGINTKDFINIKKLDQTIDSLISVADDINYRHKTDAASIGTLSWQLQNSIEEPLGYDGISYKSYISAVIRTLITSPNANNKSIKNFINKLDSLGVLKGIEYGTENKPTLDLKIVQSKVLEAILELNIDEQRQILNELQRDPSRILLTLDETLGQSHVKDTIAIALASCFMPNRIEELISSIRIPDIVILKNYIPIKHRSIINKFTELSTISDNYKARSFAYSLKEVFIANDRGMDSLQARIVYPEVSVFKDIKNVLKYLKEHNFKLTKKEINTIIGIIYGYDPGSSIGGGYLNQFIFLEDILNNVFEYTGITLDYADGDVWTDFILNNTKASSNNLNNKLVTSEPRVIKALVANHNQPHNIKKPADLLVALSDITTEHGVLKHLLKTYYTEADAKRFSLKDIESKFNDPKFAKAVWEASQNNPTIDGFAKALADLLVKDKKEKIKKTRKIKETPVVEQPTIKEEKVVTEEEKVVPEQYVATDLEQANTTKELVTLLGKKSELRSKLVSYLKKNWSGIKTDSIDDILNDVIIKLLEKSTEIQKTLDSTPDNKGRTNLVWVYVQRTAQEKASKQKRREAKVSPTLVNNEGKDIDVADAKAILDAEKPAKKEQAENLLNIIESLTVVGKTKDILLKYAVAKRDNPNLKDNEVAKLIGVTDKQLQNAKAALKKQVTMVEGELKLLRDEERPTTPREAAETTATNIIIQKSNDIIEGKTKPVSVEEARAKLETSRKIRTQIQIASSTKVEELPAAMPEVPVKPTEEVLVVTGDTKDNSVKAGSVLVPENKGMVGVDKTEPTYVSTVKVNSEKRTLTLNLDKDNIIASVEATPEETFSDLGIEKNILLEVLKESEAPEQVLIDILKEQNIDLIRLVKDDKTAAVIPTKDDVVTKEDTLDTSGRLPVIRKPEEKSPAVDPTVVDDKPAIDPTKLPVETDPKTGRSKATEPKIKTGTSESVTLNNVDKFDAQIMAGEELLRNSGTDPKFVKVLLLNFHRITSGLRENIGKTIETIPEQFLFFLDKIYEVYSTISNINKEKYGSRFEAINSIFWEYFDIEIAKELEAKGTTVEKLKRKTLEEILEFAKIKTDKAIDSYNKRHGTNLPEFTRPPSPLDFEFTVTDPTLGFPDKVKVKKGSHAAVAVASAKERITASTVRRDLGLGILVDPETTMDNKTPAYKIIFNFLKNLSQEHTEVFRSTNFIARLFRGSEKENRNKFRSALNWAANLTSSSTGEGKTLRSYFNLMRWLSSFAENGKIMTHQIVKAGTQAFQTWEGAANQVQRSKSTLIKLTKELAIKTGNLQVMKKVEDEIVKSLVINNRPLTLADVEAAVLSVNNSAKPAYIKDVFDSAVKLREEVIRRNKFILDLENSTEWITIVDEDGNPVKPENYFSLTFDANKVAQNNRSQVVDEMVRVRTNTIKNSKVLNRCIMLAMGWLWDTDGNPLTTRGKEGRDQLHIGETGFDADTLSRLEAKAGNRRYPPGTDLRKIPEIRKEADTKFFSYVDPATQQVVICAIPETIDDLSPRDLARYKETVDGSTTHIAEQWKTSYGNTKSVIQVMMEQLLMFKLREGGYSKYIQKPELGDNAFLQFFGKGGDHQGFAVSNLTWKELFDSNLLVEITRTNALEAYDNLISHRGFELLVQAELDRQLGHKGIRIYELFDVANQMLMQMAGTNEDMAKDVKAGILRLAEDYAEYAGRNPRIVSPYAEGQENFARAGGAIIRATSGQRWGLRSTGESFVNLISGVAEVGVKQTIDNVFNLFKILLDRRDSSVMRRELFLTAHGIKAYLSDMEDRLMETGIVSGVPDLQKGWFRRLIKYRRDSAGWVKPVEALGNLGVEIGSVRQITNFSRHQALVRFAQRNTRYILNGSALRLLALMENPTTKAELERLQQLSATSEKADKQLGNLQKKLAREAGFGGNWDHALTFMRFNLLDPEKLKALKYLLEKAGNNKNGVVNLNALQAIVDDYMSGPTGPIAKEIIERSFNDFMNALEVQITTDGMISESRGLNRDISLSHRTGVGRLLKSLLQWSQSFQSNVLQNLQLKKPTVVIAEVIIAYAAFTYLSELILDWLNGRSSDDIREELKDPSTYVYRMASTLPIFGSFSAIYTSGLAGISQLTGGTYKGFASPLAPPAFGVLGSYGSRVFGSGYDLLNKGTSMTPEEITAKFGDILPFNITFNGSPVAIPGRLLQEFEWLEEQNAFNKYLNLAQTGKNKYTGQRIASPDYSIVPKQSKQIAEQQEERRRKFLEDTNKMIKDRQKYKKSQ